MSEQPDLKERLAASKSVASLRAEQEVRATFNQLKWWAVEHGEFFRDLETGKLREVDVRARRSWCTPRGVSVLLDVPIEVKTLQGYHIVFAPEPDERFAKQSAQCHWLGLLHNELRATLLDAGANGTQVRQIEERFAQIAYPDGTALTFALTIDPPEPQVVSTAFRETNVGGEKDLDASVLWKATQGLRSAMESARKSDEERFRSDLHLGIKVAVESGYDVVSASDVNIKASVGSVTIFHPAVVLDARLWSLNGGQLEEVDFARFVMRERGRNPMWCDVVTRRVFEKWVDEISGHYGKQLEHPQEHVWCENESATHAFASFLFLPIFDVDIEMRQIDTNEVIRLSRHYPQVDFTVSDPDDHLRQRVATPIPSDRK